MRIRAVIFSITLGIALFAVFIQATNFQAIAASSNQEADLNPNGEAYELNIDSTGLLWISDLGAGEIWSVNPATGAYTAYQGIQAPSDARRDVAGMVWWGDWFEGRFGRLDPVTGEAAWWDAPGVAGLYGTQTDKATGDFWAVANDEPYLYRFQPGTSQLCTYTLPLNGTAYYPQVRNGLVWLGDGFNGHLLRLDPGSDIFTSWDLPDFPTPEGMAFDSGGALWFADSYVETLLRFKPGTNQLDTYDLPDYSGGGIYWPQMVAIQGHYVWYTDIWQAAVGRLDPSTATHTSTTLTPSTSPATVTCSLVAPSQTDTLSIDTGTLSWVDLTYSVLMDSDGWLVYGLPEPDVAFPWGIGVGSGYVWFVDSGRQVLGRIELPFSYHVYMPMTVK